jgi:RNA polymerase sigma factor (sigma-70 family)
VTPEEQNTQFSAWLDQHAAVLHHVANGFAEGADRHDLMQELMLAVWRAIPGYRAGAQASTFIYRVAHNTALTWRRTQKNYRERIDRFGAQAATGPAADTRREPEALEHIYAAIRRLPPLDRSLILLHLDGLDYAGIAAIHGLTESNVGARLTRLRQKLTTALEDITHELR